MIYNRINPLLIAFLALIIMASIYMYGKTGRGECISIGECTSCYTDSYVRVDDSLCGNVSEGFACVKDKAVEKRNAMVDVLQCACSKYPDEFQEDKKKLHSLLVYSKPDPNIVACDFENYPVVRWKESYIIIPEQLLNANYSGQ